MIVLLGEVGGVEEYKIVEALKQKQITKPLVAWCIGTCADYITSEVRNALNGRRRPKIPKTWNLFPQKYPECKNKPTLVGNMKSKNLQIEKIYKKKVTILTIKKIDFFVVWKSCN